jgi:guanylate kinase
MKHGLLLIVSGPSGVGKTTITRAIRERIEGAAFSVSATTRPKTSADREGVDYHFVDPAEFDRMIEAGELLEWAVVFGNKYGTPLKPIEEHLGAGRVVILDIDVKGAIQVKAAMPEAYGIFILPPDEGTLLERLRTRKRDSEETIQRRFREAKREIAEAKACGAYDVFVVNDDLERAIGEILDVVRREQASRSSE